MRDYTKEMMSTWAAEGDQAAYDLGVELLQEIEADFEILRTQSSTINAIGIYLRDTGKIDEHIPDLAPPLDTVEMSERPRLIVDAALALWRRLPPGNNLIKVQDVLQEMNNRELDLGVQQPLAVIGTVLARADGFTKVARNTFEYKRPIDDLPF